MKTRYETKVLTQVAPRTDRELRTVIALNFCLDHELDIAQEYIGDCKDLLVCNDMDHYSMKIKLLRTHAPERGIDSFATESFSSYKGAVEDILWSNFEMEFTNENDGELCLYAVCFTEPTHIEGAIISLSDLPML